LILSFRGAQSSYPDLENGLKSRDPCTSSSCSNCCKSLYGFAKECRVRALESGTRGNSTSNSSGYFLGVSVLSGGLVRRVKLILSLCGAHSSYKSVSFFTTLFRPNLQAGLETIRKTRGSYYVYTTEQKHWCVDLRDLHTNDSISSSPILCLHPQSTSNI